MADDKTPPPTFHFGDVLAHINEKLSPKGFDESALEATIDNYRTFQEETIPVFTERHIDDSRKIYDTFKQHVAGSEALASKGDLHINEKVGKHKGTLEDALFEALKTYHSGHGVPVKDMLNLFGEDKAKQLDWLAATYDQRTGANPNKGEGMSALLNNLREGDPEAKISRFYNLLRQETDDKGINRAVQTITSRALDKAFKDFESHQVALYLHKKLPDQFEIANPERFASLNGPAAYQILEDSDNLGYEQLQNFGLRKKEDKK